MVVINASSVACPGISKRGRGAKFFELQKSWKICLFTQKMWVFQARVRGGGA